MKLSLLLGVILLVTACNRSANTHKSIRVGFSSYERVEKEILQLEDTLKFSYRKLMTNQVEVLPYNTIHLLEQNYRHAFRLNRTNEHSAIYLDRLQQLYLQEKKYALSLDWTDTLLAVFPKYKSKAALLLNAATTSEIYLKDKQKSINYYNRLLTEHPKLKQEIVEMVKARLENLNKS